MMYRKYVNKSAGSDDVTKSAGSENRPGKFEIGLLMIPDQKSDPLFWPHLESDAGIEKIPKSRAFVSKILLCCPCTC